jgi:N-acetylglutamate synthase-like GNAT family acetyltransferase
MNAADAIAAAGIAIRHDRRPGDDALIVALHREGYRPHGGRFDNAFAAYVAQTVAEAALDANPASRVWFAERDGRAIGCAALIDRGTRAQLRWVVLLPEARGLGLGRLLVERALDRASRLGKTHVYLETTDGLAESMGLYARLGFATVSEEVVLLWHGEGTEIVMERRCD